MQLGSVIFTSFFFACIHISEESFQAPISPGAIYGEDGFGTYYKCNNSSIIKSKKIYYNDRVESYD